MVSFLTKLFESYMLEMVAVERKGKQHVGVVVQQSFNRRANKVVFRMPQHCGKSMVTSEQRSGMHEDFNPPATSPEYSNEALVGGLGVTTDLTLIKLTQVRLVTIK